MKHINFYVNIRNYIMIEEYIDKLHNKLYYFLEQ